jgi:hyperosmotically inducible periplasmic protein
MRNEKKWIVAGLSLAAAMFVWAGCQTAPKDERSAGLALDDKHITERVKKSLDSEPTYKFTDVDVRTFAGIVQLSGFVNSTDQKNRAQQIAQHTEGAREVVNGITLKPAMAMPAATSRTEGESRVYQTPQSSSTSQSSSTTPSSSTQPENKSSQTTEPK